MVLVEQLALQAREERLGHGVVVGVRDGADRGSGSTWNDDVVELVASELSHLEDAGTWEVDALVALQIDGDDGWGIIDTEGNVTMRILASGLAGLSSDDEGRGPGELT